MSLFRFVAVAYSDARRDPFFPVSRVAAAWFVLRHWRWLRSDGGPYSLELHGTPTRWPR